MTFIRDLEPCYYVCKHDNDVTAKRLIAVGWLEESYPYPQGAIGDELFERLTRALDRTLDWAVQERLIANA